MKWRIQDSPPRWVACKSLEWVMIAPIMSTDEESFVDPVELIRKLAEKGIRYLLAIRDHVER